MSLIGSLLGLVLIPLKAKRQEPPPKEIDNLAVMALADELRRTTFALNYWRDTGLALIEENERVKRQRDRLSAQLRSLQGKQIAAQNYDAAVQDWGGCACVPARGLALTRNFNEGGL